MSLVEQYQSLIDDAKCYEALGFALACQSILPTLLHTFNKKQIEECGAVVALAKKDGIIETTAFGMKVKEDKSLSKDEIKLVDEEKELTIQEKYSILKERGKIQ